MVSLERFRKRDVAEKVGQYSWVVGDIHFGNTTDAGIAGIYTVGIVLCVLAVLPLFVSLIFNGEEEDFIYVACTALLLVLVALGVLLIVRVSMVWSGFQMLLEEGDYTRSEKADRKRFEPLAGIYWALVTAGYLAWSFITMRWDVTWIVWPVAGVTYAAVFGIAKALRKKNG